MKNILIFISLILFSASAYAVDPTYTALFSNKAIKGYDTVAYFTENKPVKGSEDFSFEYPVSYTHLTLPTIYSV